MLEIIVKMILVISASKEKIAFMQSTLFRTGIKNIPIFLSCSAPIIGTRLTTMVRIINGEQILDASLILFENAEIMEINATSKSTVDKITPNNIA